MKVVVYVRAEDAKALQNAGEDPASWVRELVKWGLRKRKEKK